MNILCIGDCGIDEYRPGRQRRAGGIALNFAINARACFAESDRIAIHAPLGNDVAAGVVRKRLDRSGIDLHLEECAGATPVQYIEVDGSGERHFVRYDEGVLRDYRVGASAEVAIDAADWIVTPAFQQNREMFRSVMQHADGNGQIAVDFADFSSHPDFGLVDQYLEHIDVAFFGLQDTQTGLMLALSSRAASASCVLVVTLGAAGSRALSGPSVVMAPAVPLDKVVDTTGAGDAFAAGFLARHAAGATLGDALEAGSRQAATVIARLGSV